MQQNLGNQAQEINAFRRSFSTAFLLSSLFLFLPFPVAAQNVGSAPLQLFNGKSLEGWSTWLVDTKLEDPRKVFTVTNSMIRISGEGLGYLATHKAFENYHLTLEFKWGLRNTSWGDRIGRARDSGLFLHAIGPDGNSEDGKGAFMAAIECNLFEGATGDILLIRGKDHHGQSIFPSLKATVRPERDPEGWFWWSPSGEIQLLQRWGRINWQNKSSQWRDLTGFRGESDVESPSGEWTRVQCESKNGRITIFVNGKKVNEALEVYPRKGKILLQCEGSEIYFRKVELTALE